MPSRRALPRKLLITLLKVALSLAAIAYIFSHIDRSLLLADWNKLHPPSMIAMLCLVGLQIGAIAPLRLKLMLSGFGLLLPLSSAWQVAVSGSFFEQVVLGFVGGDATRLLLLHQKDVPMKQAVAAVILDRIVGLSALALVAAPGLFTVIGLLDGTDRQRLVALAGLAVVLAAAIALVARQSKSMVRHFGELVALIAYAFGESRFRIRLVLILSLALLTHVVSVVAFSLIGRDLNLPLTFWQWFFIVPPALLLATIPITAGGWGLREAVLIAALASFGVAAETAIVPSIIFGVSGFLAALPGGIAFLVNRAAFRGVGSRAAAGESNGGLTAERLVTPRHGATDLLGDAACD